MKRFTILLLFLFVGFPLWASTNLPPATSVLLDEKKVIELTDGLMQYQNPPRVLGQLTSVGSGVGTILIQQWASEFAKLHPETVLNIRGGGGVNGLTELLNGQADFVPLSQRLPEDYIARFKTKFGYEPTPVIVAQDAIGVFVNKRNPIPDSRSHNWMRSFPRTPGAAVDDRSCGAIST